MPCCNDSEKDGLEFWKMKEKNEKVCEKREMYTKNNGTYFSLNKRIFVLQFTVLLVPLVKGNVKQLFLESDLTNNFH
jgi:hypothetical protein